MTLRPDPFTEIREALRRYRAAHAHYTDQGPCIGARECNACRAEDALAALVRLEREAAERETALAEAYAHGYDRASSLAMEHAGEVEAERDRLATAGGFAVERIQRAEATVTRQAETLHLYAHCRHGQIDCFCTVEARAVLASPEAAAAEPARDWKTPLGNIAPTERHLLSKTYFERYFLGVSRDRPESAVEVTQDEFVRAENASGFRPKPGCGPTATGGFGTGGSYGRVESLWPAAALPAVDAPPPHKPDPRWPVDAPPEPTT